MGSKRRLLAWFAVWLGLGLFFTVRAAWIAPTWSWNPANTRWVWVNAAVFQLSFYLLWGVFSLAAVRLARRWPLSGPGWPGRLLRHLPIGLAMAAIHLLVLLLPLWLANALLADGRPFDFSGNLERAFRWHFHTDVAIYGLILLSWEAIDFARRADDRALAAARLAEQLAEARLAALRLQVRPPLVFDTLEAVGVRMHDDVEAAERLVLRLAAYLRSVLDLGDETSVPLREEIALLERYLEIERTRLGAPLPLVSAVDPRSTLSLVPGLLLQPLAEAAVRDAREVAGLALHLTAQPVGGRLEIELQLRASGGALSAGPALAEALVAARARLRASDPAAAVELVESTAATGGASSVRLSLPGDAGPEVEPAAPDLAATGVRVWTRRERVA